MRKLYFFLLLVVFYSCTSKLDLKPESTLVVPKTAQDLTDILNNTTVMNRSTGFAQISADEYLIPTLANFNALIRPMSRAAYIWAPDLFGSLSQIDDWNKPYEQIFLCNNVIEIGESLTVPSDADLQKVIGWAYFGRAYAYYTLVTYFAKGYDQSAASTDLGVPLKLSPAVTQTVKRSNVEDTYNQIVKDALRSAELLQTNIVEDRKNRPSKAAAYAFLARVYLSMRKYDAAEEYADKCLLIYSKLTNYNTLPIRTTSSFTINSEETIYFESNEGGQNDQVYGTTGALYTINPDFFNLYDSSDLRLQIYFSKNANGNNAWKGVNNSSRRPFTGLATDEIYLIKAECLARRGVKEEALGVLNSMVQTRYKTGTFQNITATTASEALDKILLERKKALIWRGLRWSDLKRLNLEGRNIVLSRSMGGVTYTLQPNSPLYIEPIPPLEVNLTGLQQNLRN